MLTYKLIGILLILISILVANPVLKRIKSDQNDDSFGFATLKKFRRKGGSTKTILVYGCLMLGTGIYLLPIFFPEIL